MCIQVLVTVVDANMHSFYRANIIIYYYYQYYTLYLRSYEKVVCNHPPHTLLPHNSNYYIRPIRSTFSASTVVIRSLFIHPSIHPSPT